MRYAGDVTPTEAYEVLSSDDDAVLVDVRTRPELVFVGVPDLSPIGKRLVTDEWQTFPVGTINDAFVDQLRAAGVSEDQSVYFICRSGGRSMGAAALATAAGFDKAYNVTGGFEGAVDPEGHRGTTAGWKFSDLPWRQG